jgi:hypothetical protein
MMPGSNDTAQSLRSMVDLFDQHNYDSYMLGERNAVQLNGNCWLGDFEMWVQSDVLSIRRDAPLSGMFLRKYNIDFWWPASCQTDHWQLARAVPVVRGIVPCIELELTLRLPLAGSCQCRQPASERAISTRAPRPVHSGWQPRTDLPLLV